MPIVCKTKNAAFGQPVENFSSGQIRPEFSSQELRLNS